MKKRLGWLQKFWPERVEEVRRATEAEYRRLAGTADMVRQARRARANVMEAE